MRAYLVLLSATSVLLATLTGCRTPGTLAGRQPGASFVRDPGEVVYTGPEGLTRIRLDGSGAKPLFGKAYRALDVSDDGRLWVLSDAETRLYLGDGESGQVRPIEAEGDRVADAALSPDASRVAVVRHADFHQPQRDWHEDDQLDVVEVATGAVTPMLASRPVRPSRVAWSPDGATVWIQAQEVVEEVRLADGARHLAGNVPTDVRARPTEARRATCPATGARLEADDQGIRQLGPAGERRVVRIEGRRRGLHDYLPTVETAFYSPSCATVVFAWEGEVYAADVQSGQVGLLAVGDDPWLAP